MKTQGTTLAHRAIFRCRIYSIFPAVAFYSLFLNISFSQEIGAYRTIATGNFENIGIWEIYDGTVWSPAVIKPGQLNDVYVDQLTKLILTGNESVKSLYINSQGGAGEKLNLSGYNIDIYGTLQAFSGAAPGIPTGSFQNIDWIGNSITSTLTFKGTSRIIIPDGAWTAQSTYSRFSVIFDPGPGIELITQRAFKALQFTVRSGILRQKINTSSTPIACATFSFNNHNSFGENEYGDFIIEPNGIFISECNSDIIFRSESKSASLFQIQSGGELILEGTSPQIEAANFQLDGKVTFRKNSETQHFLSKSYASSATPLTFHDLEIQGSQNVSLPDSLSVSGNITKVGTGSFNLLNTQLSLIGSGDQSIAGFAMDVNDLMVNKSGGKVYLDQNLTVQRNLHMLSGQLDFQNNQLSINTTGAGNYTYTAGSWENLIAFNFYNTPNLTASNATFPFGDRYHGGIRKVQLIGDHAGGNLSINYTEYKGADFNPEFKDLDDTDILYRLYSYFQFSGLSASSNPLQMKISADKLIVAEPEDLRLVCTGYAAPGSHVESSDKINLWAIRDLTFNDLLNRNFTVGSFRTLSVLPVTWLSLSAKAQDNFKRISWSVAQEKDNEKFEIYNSSDPNKDWTKIGEVTSDGNSDVPVSYSFVDRSMIKAAASYYQIRQVDFSGKWSWSHVVRLENDLQYSTDQFAIFPNPHSYGNVTVRFPKAFYSEKILANIYSSQGVLISSFSFNEVEFSEKLKMLLPGLYLIHFSNGRSSLHTKWIKR